MGGVDSWLRYADNFYRLLLQHSEHMARFGLSEEEMTQMQASVQALMASRHKHIACKGMAQNATQQRNQVIRKLDHWMKDFKLAARFALREEPQLLEALDIMVRSPA